SELDVESVIDNLPSSSELPYFFPAYLLTVSPIYKLPSKITNTTNEPTLNDYPLYPFALDLKTIAGIFTGRITTFTHPDIVANNPGMDLRYTKTGVNPNFNVVVCCNPGTLDPQVATNIFATALYNQNAEFKAF